MIIALALLLVMPFFMVFGALSDKIGRKKIMMAGCLIAVIAYIPIYHAMERAAGNNIVGIQSTTNKVTGAISLTAMTVDRDRKRKFQRRKRRIQTNSCSDCWCFIQVIFVCMVYGPIAAFLVESFSAKVRYTSLSLPYHIGNGVFGGLLPLIGLSLCAATGNIYAGLYYPMIVAGITFIVGSLLLKRDARRKDLGRSRRRATGTIARGLKLVSHLSTIRRVRNVGGEVD